MRRVKLNDYVNDKGVFSNIMNYLSEPESVYIEATNEEQHTFLKYVEYNDVEAFSLKGFETWAKCVKIYDGDTGTFIFFLNGRPFRFRVRFANIDTAELKSDLEEEKYVANYTKNLVSSWMFDKVVYLKCYNFDKYGRVLADIYPNNDKIKCYNRELLDKGLAYVYQGATRKHFKDWFQKEKTEELNIIDNNIMDEEALQ